ncbi:CASP-like protein UU1 isoform X1 [Physcomitrium patens]|nr:CASP-like protein UU1 isoform X1 [Physcomitrium patens]PNR60397.1 hypothetical protein PHYPA_003190 [Physcomitrium patens]|eukprot:XP_024368395.1 CASP-like protein UU1 isoform X1 [Physcomitrella patens]
MESGAWDSEYFDKRATPGVGAVGGSKMPPPHAHGAVAPPPAMYNNPAMESNKDDNFFGAIVLSLRAAQIVFTVVGLGVMGSLKHTSHGDYYYYYYDFSFTQVDSYIGVLSLDVIVCLYAIVQLVLCFIQRSNQGKYLSSPTTVAAKLTFVFDQVLAYALVATAGAAAGSALEIRKGTSCSGTWTVICSKGEASVAMSFFAFAFLAATAAVYSVRLLRITGR